MELKRIYDIITKSNPDLPNKKNVVWYVGPANSGKTYVLNSLCTLFVMVGQIKTLPPGNQFPYQALIDKRIGKMDEPYIPESFIEDFKELFAYQSITVNQKYQDASELKPMPFIVMSNKHLKVIDMGNAIWSSRIHVRNVNELPSNYDQLFGVEKSGEHIYPLAWLHVFKKYLNVNF